MSSGPSGVTPIMVKIEVLDSELSEIDYRRFNFPWCTGYDPKIYIRDIDFIIQKKPNDYFPHRL